MYSTLENATLAQDKKMKIGHKFLHLTYLFLKVAIFFAMNIFKILPVTNNSDIDSLSKEAVFDYHCIANCSVFGSKDKISRFHTQHVWYV
jgi:hypothetical protein